MDLFLHYLTLPYLLQGVRASVLVTLLGLAAGLCGGLLLAAMQLSGRPAVAGLARAYTVVFRGTPLILQMVFVYDALPHVGIRLDAITAGALALAANEAPFIAEILRSGVLGVDRGQILAGQALGMTPWVLMRRIIAPQAIRSMVPAFGNEAVSALKNSSLASAISVEELTLRSTQLASSTFDFFSIFCASGLIYLALAGVIAAAQLLVERALDLDRRARRALLPGPAGAAAAGPATLPAPVLDAGPAAPAAGAPAAGSAPATGAGPGGVPARAADAAIRVTGLGKAYGGRTVLNKLDLVIPAGEVVALLGPSGSGKSTLLRCINHLETWEAGNIHVRGHRLGYRADGQRMRATDLARERAALGVGMVFQQFNLFPHLTVQENVAGPLRWVHGLTGTAAASRAVDLLTRVGLANHLDALPRQLSGGQQQRVAIARALAPAPAILLLDEPTSALDPELVFEVLDVIRTLVRESDLTLLISTHQLNFAEEVADRVLFLSGGEVIEDGPAREVLRHPSHPLTARFLGAMQFALPARAAP